MSIHQQFFGFSHNNKPHNPFTYIFYNIKYVKETFFNIQVLFLEAIINIYMYLVSYMYYIRSQL